MSGGKIAQRLDGIVSKDFAEASVYAVAMPENVLPISPEVRRKFESTRIARLATMDVMGAPHFGLRSRAE